MKATKVVSLDETALNDSVPIAVDKLFSFKPVSSSEMTLVAFTFVFCLEEGEIKIKIHHSSPVL